MFSLVNIQLFVAVNFARQIPHGILLFFPSYPVMNKCIEHWQVHSLLYYVFLLTCYVCAHPVDGTGGVVFSICVSVCVNCCTIQSTDV